MADHGARAARYARGGFLAAVCTLLALAGHSLGGGGGCCLPPLPAVLVIGGAVGVLSVGLAGRMMSFWQILTVVGWAQIAFHFSFTLMASAPAHHMGAAPQPAGPGQGLGPGLGPSMVAGHALAAVAAAALLAGAERVLWWLRGAIFAVGAVLRLVLRPVEVHRPPWIVVVADDPAPRPGALLARSVRRRGPPVVPRPHAV